MTKDRRLEAKRVRDDAANKAYNREHPTHKANGDEQRYACANYLMSFTKGLDHDVDTGILKEKWHLEALRKSIDNGVIEPFTTRVPVPKELKDPGDPEKGYKKRLMWEAPTAGVVYNLQGPDAQAVTMAPAPALCSDELNFEMAEVYELALLRDTPFYAFDANGGPGSGAITSAVTRLNNMSYANDGFNRRPRKTNDVGKLDLQTAFRGSSPGVGKGPYLSQFLIMGNEDEAAHQHLPEDGIITYGSQTIDQRVPEAKKDDDYMVKWGDWHHIQQGYKVSRRQNFKDNRRLIFTPRDLATYVHFDALYQAYLNACLILLSNGTPFDPSFENLSGVRNHQVLTNAADGSVKESNSGGFALYGGPHILTLVTEVATRALKAVRYQKFNNHLRLRPEALAGRLEKADVIDGKYPELCGAFTKMANELSETTTKVRSHNRSIAAAASDTILLPMAFPEGSPMHPAYGAGHATVAGACITILKAYFDTSAIFAQIGGIAGFYGRDKISKAENDGKTVKYIHFQVEKANKKSGESNQDFYKRTKGGTVLRAKNRAFDPNDENSLCPLTLEGELNKLAANISIARNMAGVHYFSDYYDSLRMGEEIAIGILEEQALCYPLDPFVMSLPTFDGEVIRIGRR